MHFLAQCWELLKHLKKAKLQACSTREFGLKIVDATYVTLHDPNEIETEVMVEKNNGKLYFKDDWHGLGDYYKIAHKVTGN